MVLSLNLSFSQSEKFKIINKYIFILFKNSKNFYFIKLFTKQEKKEKLPNRNKIKVFAYNYKQKRSGPFINLFIKFLTLILLHPLKIYNIFIIL